MLQDENLEKQVKLLIKLKESGYYNYDVYNKLLKITEGTEDYEYIISLREYMKEITVDNLNEILDINSEKFDSYTTRKIIDIILPLPNAVDYIEALHYKILYMIAEKQISSSNAKKICRALLISLY